ncbi:hypothetical protein AB0C96_32420 [Streptomyces sp. NPDC048506]|uniref:hypothetical protein n=1 Tax=Streptomyces sp. NPDC048506 TaxID=3155028 RepID=UPI00343CA8B2
MNTATLRPERRAVRQAAHRLTEEATALTAASAEAFRADLAARASDLRHAVLTASHAEVSSRVIAEDAQLPPQTVREWIEVERCAPVDTHHDHRPRWR